MTQAIHPTAIVAPGAVLGEGVTVGPFCLVGEAVSLADGVTLHSHVVVAGRTRIGARTQVYPFASLGHPPQDLKYRGEPSELVVGADCLIREGVTMNPGTAGGGLRTEVGERCVFLAQSHVAHDCKLGNNVICSNNVMLAGHCTVGDFAILGGGCAAHQFVRIGAHAFVGGLTGVENDLIPYGMAIGNRAHLAGLNIVGLKRRGFEREQIHALRRAYRLLFADEGTLKERLEDVASEFVDEPLVQEMVSFVRAGGDRAICTPRDAAGADA
ncbi:acyl-ACP--UDP-N-acetylglucosamine O-acyltransferase [Labrys wisconsinensis]|uniref:Acyl-[acyl-carrier-protein]--UDP-N-acetylglucosamine O-acyltransferase n=1 Tax=Labrys wisconsinensis TaxID=425677 RepID=A0ABU0J7Q6_9HYPH|nr:acyl-ACP--UDP-N-acetylglucosamine O-acyltransferase [Labrys wisconsinensis]MDQ0469304.1 UDP-N-acetylglucosamine acyltransferase [Labrys wisconsinensis]